MERSNAHLLVCHTNRMLCECLCFTLRQLGYPVRDVSGENLTPTNLTTSDLLANILLMDAQLEIGNLTAIVELVRRKNQDCRLLLLASRNQHVSPSELSCLAADGWLSEDGSLESLQEAIETLLDGDSYCSPEVANELFLQIGASSDQEKWLRHMDNVRLTRREREILELIAWERLGNRQIAKRLSISLYTVKNHVHNIIEKLGVVDRYEAAEYATKRRMLMTLRN